MPVTPTDARPRVRWWRWLLTLTALTALGACAFRVKDVLAGPNIHTVVPGELYRSGQLSGKELERLVRRHGVRTVINLRGYSQADDWFRTECETTLRLNVSQEDLPFSARRLPSVPALRQLLDVLDHSERPLLVHCHKGADRTGLTCALYLLLHKGASLERARRELGAWRGHLRLGATARMDEVLDLYEEWLAGQGRPHTPEELRRWIREGYCGREGRAELTVLAPPGPVRMDRGRWGTVRVRCRNTSVRAWHFQPGRNAGTHVKYQIFNDQEEPMTLELRSGLFHATVRPGEHLDVTLPVPPVEQPGRYVLLVDMMEEQHASFLQLGNPPLRCELEVL